MPIILINFDPPEDAGMVKHERGVFPSVRRLLDEYSINAKDVTPTGPLGRVLKGDVLAFISKWILLTWSSFFTVTRKPIILSYTCITIASATIKIPR
jgi:hypothetical protein